MFSFKQARRKISVSSTMARNGIQYAWNSEDSAIYMSLKSKQIDDARLTIEKYDTDNCLISGTLRISLKSSSNAIDVKECTFVDVPLERSWYR
jgi:ribosomal protein L33